MSILNERIKVVNDDAAFYQQAFNQYPKPIDAKIFKIIDNLSEHIDWVKKYPNIFCVVYGFHDSNYKKYMNHIILYENEKSFQNDTELLKIGISDNSLLYRIENHTDVEFDNSTLLTWLDEVYGKLCSNLENGPICHRVSTANWKPIN